MQKYTGIFPTNTTENVIHTLLTKGKTFPRPSHQLFAVYNDGDWQYFLGGDEMYEQSQYPYFICHGDLINPYRDGDIPAEVLPDLIAENIQHIENIFGDGGYVNIYPSCYLRHKVTSDGYATEIFYHNQWIPLYQQIDKPNEEHYMGWCSAYFVGYLLTRR